jgi:hypothetical protein
MPRYTDWHTYRYNIFIRQEQRYLLLTVLNSQEINSLVVIITVGHSRVMALERVVWAPGEEEHDKVLETKYLVLSHNSLFILHPLDERPSLRDTGSKQLSYWKHGRVRLMCTNAE